MTRSIDEAISEISLIRRMPNGPAKCAASLAALEHIDAEGPPEAKAYALHALIEAYVFGDDEEKAIVPFTQSIALYDAHPELFDEADRYNLFWAFKWMVGDLRRFPGVKLNQLEASLTDMERRYALEGFTMDAPCQQRWLLARHRGAAETPILFDRWLLQTRDEMSDCDLCAAGNRMEYLVETGHVADGLEIMESVFADQSIRQECFSEPATMLSVAQFAYLLRGEPGDASKAVGAHRRCRSYLGGGASAPLESGDDERAQERAYALAGTRGRCIEFLARTGNEEAAVRLLEDNARFLTHAESPFDRLEFLRYTGAALHVLVDECGLGDKAVGLKAPLPNTLAELWPWVRGQAESLAADFDSRNETTHQTDLLKAAWQTQTFPERLDMRVVTDEAPVAAPRPEEPLATTDPDSMAVPALLVKQAERLVIRREPEVAIDTYLQAAAQFEQLGRLSEAGFARAEAGHLALLLDDLDGAEQCLGRAAQLLKASATPPQYASPVAIALAECLARLCDTAKATGILDQQAATLDAALGEPVPDGEAGLVTRARQDDLRWARTKVDEVKAAILIDGGDTSGPVLAEQAAKSYAALGLIEPAAQTFQLAGGGWAGIDDDKAVWCLQSAMEGFELALRRKQRALAANQLVTLLRRLGRGDEAAKVAAGL